MTNQPHYLFISAFKTQSQHGHGHENDLLLFYYIYIFITCPHQIVRVVIAHMLASRFSQPNSFRAGAPVYTQLNIPVWRAYLKEQANRNVADFLEFGWSINYAASVMPMPTRQNHQSALTYPDHMEHYLHTELSDCRFFRYNPLHHCMYMDCPFSVILLSFKGPLRETRSRGIYRGGYIIALYCHCYQLLFQPRPPVTIKASTSFSDQEQRKPSQLKHRQMN